MSALLDIKNLSICYGSIMAVKGIDLEVREGQIVSLIGANGAGKTTVLLSLSGLVKAREGSIQFHGNNITNAAPHRITKLRIVQVPEGRQIFSRMSVKDNLIMGGFLVKGKAEIEQRMQDVFNQFPILKKRSNMPAGSLSGGEQQMLAMGRALMARPRLLLLDEPSMGLAPLIVEEIFMIIEILKQKGTTILLVEQNAQLALEIADYAYVLETGKINMHGPSTVVASDPSIISAYLGGN